MRGLFRFLLPGICAAACLLPGSSAFAYRGHGNAPAPPRQETGFLNRRIVVQGVLYRFQVYLPEEYRKNDHQPWPIILFLHGRGERGDEGMWQTQVGLPQELRDHPERWPFIVVMPQCTFPHFWTDADMLQMAMATLDQETAEFHADRDRTYLTGLSMGGYGAWELAKMYPQRWAAIVIAAGGPFWSYAPERWREANTLPAEYARALGHTPVWLFHGSEDHVVPVRESELMYGALKAQGGHVRLWIFQGLHHDCWTRAYNEPELPRWILDHRLSTKPETQAFAERMLISLHPNPIKMSPATLDTLVGEYRDPAGHLAATLFRQGNVLYQRDPHGEIAEIEPESPNSLFYPSGSTWTRLLVERDAMGRVTGLVYRDDRHSERWERMAAVARTRQQPD